MCQNHCPATCRERSEGHPTSCKPSSSAKPVSPSKSSSLSSSSSSPKREKSAAKIRSYNILRQAWYDFTRGRKLRKQEALVLHRTDVEPSKPAGYGVGWTFHLDKEYPWRIFRSIPGDENWRGTWLLEVKDISDVEWTQQLVHDGRSWKSVTLPNAPHWPTCEQLDQILVECVGI